MRRGWGPVWLGSPSRSGDEVLTTLKLQNQVLFLLLSGALVDITSQILPHLQIMLNLILRRDGASNLESSHQHLQLTGQARQVFTGRGRLLRTQ